MKTLVLKHNGHEAHVPYDLPDSLRVDCFVPEEGLCKAVVDCRAEAITIIEVQRPDGTFMGVGTYLDAVYEQAGDVCAVFEHALDLSATAHFHRRPDDAKTLATIAEMALLESDLHTAWTRLPLTIADIKLAPTQVTTEWAATKCLARFITEVLVPRAQDLATAAAKRREAQWEEEQAAAKLANYEATWMDALTKRSKERA